MSRVNYRYAEPVDKSLLRWHNEDPYWEHEYDVALIEASSDPVPLNRDFEPAAPRDPRQHVVYSSQHAVDLEAEVLLSLQEDHEILVAMHHYLVDRLQP